MSEGRPALVLYDGECRFCRWCADWARRHDRDGRLQLEPYQASGDSRVTPELRLACASALHVVTPAGRVLRRGRAVLYVVQALGYRKAARVLTRRPLIWGVEAGYRAAARYRGALSRLTPY